jgi:hypothetical protein
MKVYCTQHFRDNLKKLARNSSYAAIVTDVCSFLQDKSLSELHQMNDIINVAPGKYSLNKYRIINSLTNKGKSSSYRCISVCLPEEDCVYLDTIYPKTGSEGKDNLDKKEYKAIAANVAIARKANDLYLLDIKKGQFEAIQPKG